MNNMLQVPPSVAMLIYYMAVKLMKKLSGRDRGVLKALWMQSMGDGAQYDAQQQQQGSMTNDIRHQPWHYMTNMHVYYHQLATANIPVYLKDKAHRGKGRQTSCDRKCDVFFDPVQIYYTAVTLRKPSRREGQLQHYNKNSLTAKKRLIHRGAEKTHES